ncbi:MAG: hypothetical protein OTJ97_06220 [SAR202 cluster bacterium]|nr:hypothetical protein [SAR202 cluster bacterium]
MSNVDSPRSESAAARLMAVVVFPTPPFWFAIVTIILNGTGGGSPGLVAAPSSVDRFGGLRMSF